jgi:hypothetical protein
MAAHRCERQGYACKIDRLYYYTGVDTFVKKKLFCGSRGLKQQKIILRGEEAFTPQKKMLNNRENNTCGAIQLYGGTCCRVHPHGNHCTADMPSPPVKG